MKQTAPDLWNYMAKVLTGSGKLIEDIFNFFGVHNTQDYTPSMDALSKITMMLGEIGASFANAPNVQGALPSPTGTLGGPVAQGGQVGPLPAAPVTSSANASIGAQ